MSLQSEFNDAVEAALELVGEQMVSEIKTYLRRHGKDATGELIDSISYEIDGDSLILKATARHAVYVHEGTDPHWPPAGALTGWVQQVGFAPGLSIESRDYLARKSIAESGTEALPFLEEPITRRSRAIAALLQRQIDHDINAADLS